MFEALEMVRLGFRMDMAPPKTGFLGAKLRGAIGNRLKRLVALAGGGFQRGRPVW